MPWPGLGNHMPPMLGPTHGVLGSKPLSPPVSHSKRPPPPLAPQPTQKFSAHLWKLPRLPWLGVGYHTTPILGATQRAPKSNTPGPAANPTAPFSLFLLSTIVANFFPLSLAVGLVGSLLPLALLPPLLPFCLPGHLATIPPCPHSHSHLARLPPCLYLILVSRSCRVQNLFTLQRQIVLVPRPPFPPLVTS